MPTTTTFAPRRVGPKRVRQLQRAVHLTTGVVLLVYVYGTNTPAITTGFRWIVLAVLVASGVAMWQWPRVRRLLRARAAGG